MRMIIVVVFALQIHHLFTVGASTKALNWFTKSNKIIYVNVDRALVVMSTEDRAYPNKVHMLDMARPATLKTLQAEEANEELDEENQEEVEPQEPQIDFSENIEMGTEEFLEYLRKKQSGELEAKEEKKGKGWKRKK